MNSEYGVEFSVDRSDICLYHTNDVHCAWLSKRDLERMIKLIEEQENTLDNHMKS
jgi:hypothetical protein